MPVIQNNILPIRLGSAQSYFIPTPNGAVLIDAGNAHKTTQLKSVLHAHEYDLSDIRYIILTHTHHDHVGSLAELKKRTGARIIVHEHEAGFLRMGRTPLPKGTGVYSKIMVAIGKLVRVGKYPPVAPDILITHTLDLSEIGVDGYVQHTPGHTRGSSSIILRSGVAFVGDTLFHITPDTVFPPFANDVDQLLQSWQVLIQTGCTTFYPAHGRPIEREKLKRCFAKQLRKYKPQWLQ